MSKLPGFTGRIDHEFDDEFDIDEEYTGFEKIKQRSRSEEELHGGKKRTSVKHQRREDKE